MKKIALFTAALLFVSSQAVAQDAPATGIGYIPGMPVPQASAPAAPAGSDAAPAATNSGNGGKISKVSVAGSQKNEPQPAPEEPPVQIDNGPAGYKGVTPPSRMVPENQNTFAKTSGNQLSWIGFMPEQNAHRVFVQTSQPTQFERLATPSDRVEILISNTKLAVHNNQRELDMTYFQTPFAKAKAVRSGTGVKVIVQLKEAVPCDVRQNGNMIEIVVKK